MKMADTDIAGDDRPKYEKAKAVLLTRIGSMPSGVKLPSVQALCDELGMSQGTIMRAINDLVEDGMIERRRNRGAFVARGGVRTSNILVVWPDLIEQVTEKPLSVHPNTSRILHAVQEAAEKTGKNVLVTRKLATDQSRAHTGANAISGVIILFNYDRSFVDSFVRDGIPVVLIEPLVRGQGVPFVMKDHCENIRNAALHLARLGHRRIAYISIDSHFEPPTPGVPPANLSYIIDERIRGFSLAMREAGIESAAMVISSPAKSWSAEYKDEIVGRLIKSRTTACCCFNDDIAVRLLNLCNEHRIPVPAQISIVGHDDAAIASAVQPPLTTIQPPLDEMGGIAVSLLQECIEGRTTEGQGVIVPSKLIERTSVLKP